MAMELRYGDTRACDDAQGDPRHEPGVRGVGADGTASLRVLHLGPSLEVRGGVSSVERLIVDGLAGHVRLKHVPTMVEGSAGRRLVVFWRALLATAKELRTPGPLVVHVHFASRGSTLRKLLFAAMVLRAKRPLVMHAHGAEFDRFFVRLPSPARSLVASLLRRADCCLTLSRRWRDFFVERCGVSAARTRILCNPVRVPPAVPDRTGRERVQFLFLGRIGPRKGAFELLQAFAALPDATRARARLVLAGDGDVDALRKLAEPLGDAVTVLSWLDPQQRDRLLLESDVFVLPSHAEGVPMSVLEAMAWGLPVVTTPVGGIPDVASHEVEGLIVTPGDIGQIAGALTRMIEDESGRERFARAARARAESLDVSHYVEQLLQLYRALALHQP
jgi:glycosyltransferase involved in cell wall biosynthesis